MPDLFFFPLSNWQKRKAARALIKKHSLDPWEKITLSAGEYASKFLKPDADDKKLPLDRLRFDLVHKEDTSRHYLACPCRIDTPHHVVLVYCDRQWKFWGLAVIGFKVDFLGRNILVKQIQGARLGTYPLAGDRLELKIARSILLSLRWEKMLIRALEDWARSFGFRKIGILSARRNEWYQSHHPPNEGRNLSLKLHYDITAERMKYKRRLLSKYLWKLI